MGGFYGKVPYNYIESIEITNGASVINYCSYEYTFNEEGYPILIRVTENNRSESLFEIEWEQY